ILFVYFRLYPDRREVGNCEQSRRWFDNLAWGSLLLCHDTRHWRSDCCDEGFAHVRLRDPKPLQPGDDSCDGALLRLDTLFGSLLLGACLLEIFFGDSPNIRKSTSAISLTRQFSLLTAEFLQFGSRPRQLRRQFAGFDVVVGG